MKSRELKSEFMNFSFLLKILQIIAKLYDLLKENMFFTFGIKELKTFEETSKRLL